MDCNCAMCQVVTKKLAEAGQAGHLWLGTLIGLWCRSLLRRRLTTGDNEPNFVERLARMLNPLEVCGNYRGRADEHLAPPMHIYRRVWHECHLDSREELSYWKDEDLDKAADRATFTAPRRQRDGYMAEMLGLANGLPVFA